MRLLMLKFFEMSIIIPAFMDRKAFDCLFQWYTLDISGPLIAYISAILKILVINVNISRNILCGPVHICSLYTTPSKCSRDKFSVHECSDCEHCEMFSVPLRWDLKSAHISVCAVYLLCMHCATCEVILTCTLRADSSLRAKPCPVSTCSRFHIVQTSFRRYTKGEICSENMVWPCSSWNCSSGNTTL